MTLIYIDTKSKDKFVGTFNNALINSKKIAIRVAQMTGVNLPVK